MNTPVLFIIFNRLETTKQVFSAVRDARPKQLFIAADGPRDSKEGESKICDSVREFVINSIDWDCNVKTLFQKKNLGCGRNPAGAISWFFENVEEGIILEDDCIPSASFFNFCDVLLEKYRYNEQIFVIGGNNFQAKPIVSSSYYFSAMGHIWGWATWRRAWKYFKYALDDYDVEKYKRALRFYFEKEQQIDYWMRIFVQMKSNLGNDIWDYQWSVCQWYHRAINIVPSVNLVKNIGFGVGATHTQTETPGVLNVDFSELNIIIHPTTIKIQRHADLFTFYKNFERKKKYYFLIKCRDKVICEFYKFIKGLR